MDVYVMESSFYWDDIGNWTALKDICRKTIAATPLRENARCWIRTTVYCMGTKDL